MRLRGDLLRFHGAVEHDPAIEAWFDAQPGELVELARPWFQVMRNCGDEVRELLHDGCPVACLGDYPFAQVDVFRAHVNVAFFQGASLPDPDALLEGTGRFMRHVKLRPGRPVSAASLHALIDAAYQGMKARAEGRH